MSVGKVFSGPGSPQHIMMAKHVLVRTLRAVAVVGALYFVTPVALLHWGLDSLIFSSQSHGITHESQRYDIDVANNANIVVRRYGNSGSVCAFFFPGQLAVSTSTSARYSRKRACVQISSFPLRNCVPSLSCCLEQPRQTSLSLGLNEVLVWSGRVCGLNTKGVTVLLDSGDGTRFTFGIPAIPHATDQDEISIAYGFGIRFRF